MQHRPDAQCQTVQRVDLNDLEGAQRALEADGAVILRRADKAEEKKPPPTSVVGGSSFGSWLLRPFSRGISSDQGPGQPAFTERCVNEMESLLPPFSRHRPQTGAAGPRPKAGDAGPALPSTRHEPAETPLRATGLPRQEAMPFGSKV
jgi:hypothetical protein